MPCAHPKPFPPAAALLCAFTLCIGLGLLIGGLLPPDHPMPPIRTAQNQTPISVPTQTTGFKVTSAARSTPMFAPVGTPRSGLYVGVQSYALLSPCGIYQPDPPTQQMQANLMMAKLPAPCERRR
jgi:hypothetical protein